MTGMLPPPLNLRHLRWQYRKGSRSARNQRIDDLPKTASLERRTQDLGDMLVSSEFSQV